jgi:hypothetical protein
MPRPKSKKELLSQSNVNFKDLLAYVEGLSEEKQNAEFPASYLNRNVRDVLAHIHHWHTLFLVWYVDGMKGNKPEMPAKGYTWRTVPELNREIWKMYDETPKDKVKTLLESSFEDVQRIIKAHTNTELFEKKHFPWTGSTSLGAYIVSATSSHYDWGLKLISKCLKQV